MERDGEVVESVGDYDAACGGRMGGGERAPVRFKGPKGGVKR